MVEPTCLKKKYSNWIISTSSRGKIQKKLKPPPSYSTGYSVTVVLYGSAFRSPSDGGKSSSPNGTPVRVPPKLPIRPPLVLDSHLTGLAPLEFTKALNMAAGFSTWCFFGGVWSSIFLAACVYSSHDSQTSWQNPTSRNTENVLQNHDIKTTGWYVTIEISFTLTINCT